ncbi:unnamed protein product [Thlaspi arvense]|uniref:Uncharacterized protein n=1 Tax=Thlaspi arvense TaxID=13288 RepID=A0AAU9RXS9_THLAR|nr:unnamed protein product [Thlaspi arvense]
MPSSRSHHSHVSPTPPPKPQRSPTVTPHQFSLEEAVNSRDQRPALERMALTFRRDHSPVTREGTSDSGRLQDVAIQYLEETISAQSVGMRIPSSSRILLNGVTAIRNLSPIRTLNEDKLHVSLRLGPLTYAGSSSVRSRSRTKIHLLQDGGEEKELSSNLEKARQQESSTGS